MILCCAYYHYHHHYHYHYHYHYHHHYHYLNTTTTTPDHHCHYQWPAPREMPALILPLPLPLYHYHWAPDQWLPIPLPLSLTTMELRLKATFFRPGKTAIHFLRKKTVNVVTINTANGHILKSQAVESLIISPVNTVTCSKFKCLWHISFITLVLWACSCTVFRLQYTWSAFVAIL